MRVAPMAALPALARGPTLAARWRLICPMSLDANRGVIPLPLTLASTVTLVLEDIAYVRRGFDALLRSGTQGDVLARLQLGQHMCPDHRLIRSRPIIHGLHGAEAGVVEAGVAAGVTESATAST